MDARAHRKFTPARGAVLALVLVGLLFTSVYPLRRYIDVRHQVASLRQQERDLDAKVSQLQEEKQRLQTDAEVEKLARERLGFVRPGETSFFVPRPEVSSAPTPPVVGTRARAAPKGRSVFDRWWDAFQSAWRSFG
jgi:cell division protein FtsB